MTHVRNNNSEDHKLECKKLYLPFAICAVCPRCANEVEVDLSSAHYLSYPEINKDFNHPMWCSECDEEWDEKLRLLVDLVAADIPNSDSAGDNV